MLDNIGCFVIYFITIFPSIQLKYGDKGLESLPACNLISNVLENCFDENECYSQREMDYGRNLIAAYYIHNMNSLRVTFINFLEHFTILDQMKPTLLTQSKYILGQYRIPASCQKLFKEVRR